MKMKIYCHQLDKHFDAECKIIAATKGSFYLQECLTRPVFPSYIAIGFVNNKELAKVYGCDADDEVRVIVPIDTEEGVDIAMCLPVYTCVYPHIFIKAINNCFESEEFDDLKHTAEEVLTSFKMHGTPIHPDCLDIDKFFEKYKIKNIQQHD